MTQETSIGNPYVGPRTFSYEQRHLFFGREREGRDLLARVLSERLLLFYAQTGAGKSSLLHTSLMPQLREEKGFVVLPVGRVSGDLPAGVDQVDNIFVFNLMLSIDVGPDPARLTHVTLSDFLARLVRRPVVDSEGQAHEGWVYEGWAPPPTTPSARRYALIIDQFEEIIMVHPGRWQEREAFFRQLDQAMQADPNLWVVLTLREDYVAGLDPYAPLLADRLRARFRMERMGKDAALDAIRRPAELAGRPFASGVAEKLRDDLRQVRVLGQEETVPGQYVEPVQLQVVCYQLWENIKDQPPGLIAAADLQEAGDVHMALTHFYEETLAIALADPAAAAVSERQLRTWFDTKMITEAGTRGLVHQDVGNTGGLPNGVVRAMQRRFLVRTEARGGDIWIELVHDGFVAPIRQSNKGWFSRNLNPVTLDAQAWLDTGKPEQKLYSGSQLAEAVAQIQASPRDFGDLERSFVAAGERAEARQTTRRQRAILGAVVGLLVFFVSLATWALSSRSQALYAEQVAQISEADAISQKETADALRMVANTSEADAISQKETADALRMVANTSEAEAISNKEVALLALATVEAGAKAALATSEAYQSLPSPTPTWTHTPLRPFRTPEDTPVSELTPTPTPTLVSTPTPNQTVLTQRTQLAEINATQTALAPATTWTPTNTPLTLSPFSVDPSCDIIDLGLLEATLNTCQVINENWVCYGSFEVEALPSDVRFHFPGDRAPLSAISALRIRRGAALLYVKPVDEPEPAYLLAVDQGLIMLERVDDEIVCSLAPPGLAIYTDEGTPVEVVVNGAVIELQ